MAARYSVSLPLPVASLPQLIIQVYIIFIRLYVSMISISRITLSFFLSFKVHVSFRFFRIANGISPGFTWMDIIEIRYREIRIQCLLRPNSSHLFFTTTFTFSLQTVNYNSTMPILSETRESRETFDSEIMLKYAKSF